MGWEFGGQQIQIMSFRMDKQQGPTVYTGNYYLNLGINHH